MNEELETTTPEMETRTECMKDYEDQFDMSDPWHIVQRYLDEKTNLTLKVEGVVNGGVIVKVEGLRGFIPASRLSLSYIEDLESYLLKEITVRVIEVDPEEHRLVLSARIASIQVGTVMDGVVESIQSYGAFVRFEDGLSGLVHVSQICEKRIKTPADVLKIGDPVKVKVIGIKDGKLSLSIKALHEEKDEEDENLHVEIPKSEEIGTNLGDLFKNIRL